MACLLQSLSFMRNQNVMNQKDFSPAINQDREGHHAPKQESHRHDDQQQPITEVKNAHASGDGALGRSDELQEEDDDERGKIY
jgi:hypothetical protein